MEIAEALAVVKGIGNQYRAAKKIEEVIAVVAGLDRIAAEKRAEIKKLDEDLALVKVRHDKDRDSLDSRIKEKLN